MTADTSGGYERCLHSFPFFGQLFRERGFGFLCCSLSSFEKNRPASLMSTFTEQLPRIIPGCCCCLVAQSCLIFCDSMHYSPPGSSVHGILQARVLEWDDISFSRRIFPTQRLNPVLLATSSTLQADYLPLSHLGSIIP